MSEGEAKEFFGGRAGTAPAAAYQTKETDAPIRFNRGELNKILELYGRKVADGEWRDYAIDQLREKAVFSIFRRTSEMPLYRIVKQPRLARQQGAYSLVTADRTDPQARSRPRQCAERPRPPASAGRRLTALARRRLVPRPRPSAPLHEHAVEPAAVLVADILERAGRLEARRLVKPDRGGVRRSRR